MGCHALFQGTFLAQGSNPCLLHLLHCTQILFYSATREAPDWLQSNPNIVTETETSSCPGERHQDIETPFLSSQDPEALFFFFNAKVIVRYNQSSGILQLWLSPTIPKRVEIFFHFHVFSWNCRLSLIKKQKMGAWFKIYHYRDFPGGPVVKTLPSNAGGVSSIPGQARIPRDSWSKN